jgi:N utilization substance protein A
VSSFIFEKENPELLAVIEAISVEKSLKKDVINKAIESAFETSLIEYFHNLYNVSVKIKNSGAVTVSKKMFVVPVATNIYNQIDLETAKKQDVNATLDSEILLPLEVTGFSSNIIRNIGFLISKEIVKREKESEYSYFQKLKGFIISGVVKKVYFGGLLIGIDKYEAFLSKNQMLPTEFEKTRAGDRLEALLYEVEQSDVKPQAILTRTSETFLFELLRQAIPEILDETVQVKSIARDPGSRAKISVASKDPTLDAVMLCVSTYGRKIRSISKELCGERIDIIEWNEDPGVFLMNALKMKASAEREKVASKPINISNISVDYENKNLDVIVSEEDISLAIGRKGQNVRLLTKLIGWSIHLVTQEENSQKKFDEITKKANILTGELNIDEMVAQLLVIEKLDTSEKIANATLEEIASIEGFDEEIAESIKERALIALTDKEKLETEKQKMFKSEAGIISKETGIPEDIALEFTKVGIKNKTMLSELSVDEVIEDYKLEALDFTTISDSIMKARGF